MQRWGWIYYDNPHEAVPLLDNMQHEWGMSCPCKPTMVDNCIAHNAADGREAYEQGFRKPH